MLIGVMRQGTRLLQDNPEEPLPLAEMIRITYSRLVRIWWSLNPQSCNMCTCSGNGTQERAVQDLLCSVDLYLVYLI